MLFHEAKNYTSASDLLSKYGPQFDQDILIHWEHFDSLVLDLPEALRPQADTILDGLRKRIANPSSTVTKELGEDELDIALKKFNERAGSFILFIQ